MITYPKYSFVKHISLFIFIFISQLSIGQYSPANEIIVEYEGRNFEEIMSTLQTKRSIDIRWRVLGKLTNTYLISMSNETDADWIYQTCKSIPEIKGVDKNAYLENRVKPNDSKVAEQYYLDLIQAYEAWDVTTGGLDFGNKDIVIGVVDEGYELNHEDLIGNIYNNPDEIAGDGIDNDGNGYIDDVHGWNTGNNTGVETVRSHGTYILGMLGAKGNNGKGISGINWNIKLLTVTTGNLISQVIESYEYILAERRQYTSSGGTKGANILVTNYSGGLSRAQASDFPVWCGVYDKLGNEGILNVSAATNDNDNVDVVGDLPSTCTSPYLLVVNSTDTTDEKDALTGYGNISVDISAPGDRILTTELTSKGLYKTESGTSLSTPIVAGAAALLYSLKCADLFNLTKGDPSELALDIKSILMSTVDKKTSLIGKTVSEGRLNIFEAVTTTVAKYCDLAFAPKGPLTINNVWESTAGIKIDYLTPDETKIDVHIIDLLGRQVYTQSITPPLFGDKVVNLNWKPNIPGIYVATLVSANAKESKIFFASITN